MDKDTKKALLLLPLAVLAIAAIVLSVSFINSKTTSNADNPTTQAKTSAQQGNNAGKSNSVKHVSSIDQLVKACPSLEQDSYGTVYVTYEGGDSDGKLDCLFNGIGIPPKDREYIRNGRAFPSSTRPTYTDFSNGTWNGFDISWMTKAEGGIYGLNVKDKDSTNETIELPEDYKRGEEALFPNGFFKEETVASRMDGVQQLRDEGWTVSFTDKSEDVTSKVDAAPNDWQLVALGLGSSDDRIISVLVSEIKDDEPQSTPGNRSNVYYPNCKAVWNAVGHGIGRGDPGYSAHLDADGDGRACEQKPNY
ncbi:excalibur calcium-binding domain-containing protein [Bifidobacterium callimiconis]|uniref:Calcium-binding protein n=1 Tax=Bifidobacterium callimiconis TaxID=2306973 RepID=A0A430FI16_9BIFI|nr:excalibur calcium-binding domain-containing protein [Bifidobacterium callimiconis]RSX52412.1 calcium-binding protein [Bifidobacterium callimiconis]